MNLTRTLNERAYCEPGTFPTSDEIAEDGIDAPEFETMKQIQRISGFILDPHNSALEQHTALIAPMLLQGTENGMKMIEERGDIKRATHEDYETIPASIAALHAHVKTQRDRADLGRITTHPYRRDENTLGRNDPRPCGPGKNPRNTLAW